MEPDRELLGIIARLRELLTADRDLGVDVSVKYGRGVAPKASQPRVVLTCEQAWGRHITGLKDGTNAFGMAEDKPRTIAGKEGVWKRIASPAIGSRLLTDVSEAVRRSTWEDRPPYRKSWPCLCLSGSW